MFDGLQPDGTHNYWKSEFLSGLSDPLLETFRRQGEDMSSPMSLQFVIQLGGALADRDADATAVGNRDADAVFASAGCWWPEDPHGEQDREWARTAWEAIRPFSTGGNYVNFHTADDSRARIDEAYGESLERLAGIKAAYDADNLFRVNRNIAPAASSAVASAV